MKLFASDFDGTLFHRNPIDITQLDSVKSLKEQGYQPEDIEAIARFQKNGNLFGLCTGRAAQSALDFLPDSIHLDFLIGNSGACIYDGKGRILRKHCIEKETARKMLEILPENGLSVTTDKGFYVSRDMAFLSENPKFLDETDVLQEEIIGISSNLWSQKKAQAALEQMQDLPGIQIFQNRECLDCVSDACSKGIGVQEAANYFQIELKDTAGAGDSYNDLPLLNVVQQAYTFEDCPDALKEKAKVVDSVAQALQDIQS